MAVSSPALTNPAWLAHVIAFGAAALACFGSVPRVRAVGDRDTRQGLVALLVTSGAWATAHVLFLTVPSRSLKIGFYVAGLVVGLAAVGPWLYFCSAYTGRALHRNPTLQRIAVLVFVAIVLVKVTNPLHHLYFTSTVVAEPFPHLAIDSGLPHWIVLGLSYALATVGYFMLLELFVETGSGTAGLAAVAGVTSVPLALDVAGVTVPSLLDVTYEPLGVAVFAVGVSFVYFEQFEAIRLASGRDEAVIVLTDDRRIRDYNSRAAWLFPGALTADAIGAGLEDVLPAVAAALGDDEPVLEHEQEGSARYYRVSSDPVGANLSAAGETVALTDVTQRERYRRELERQNERLEQFASMVSHDLRNPLNVATGRLELARESGDDEHLAAVASSLSRMETMIEDLLEFARTGQPIEETAPVQLAAVAEASWDQVDTGAADLVVEGNLAFEADADRLQNLLENLFRNAVEHSSTGSRPGADDAVEHAGAGISVRIGPTDGADGFYVSDDGPGIPADERERIFEFGYTTADEGTGFGLSIVQQIAAAHDWEVHATESADGGARFEVTGVTPVDERAERPARQ